MLQLIGVFLLSVVHSSQGEKLSYQAAYTQAQAEHKTLLVVVGANWCAACKTLKSGTLEPMEKAGKLDCVVMTQIDKDEQPELAKQIMVGTTLPQVIAYQQTESGWKRLSLTGLQSESRVEELIRTATKQNDNETKTVATQHQ